MNAGKDLSELYSLRQNFTVIGLTGRNGSGYNLIASQLEKQFLQSDFPDPGAFDLTNNSYKKYNIIYKYWRENSRRYTLIKYKDVLTLYLLKSDFASLKQFIYSTNWDAAFSKLKNPIEPNFDNELKQLDEVESDYNLFRKKFLEIGFENITTPVNGRRFCAIFFGERFKDFSSRFHTVFQSQFFAKHNVLFEILTNNIRQTGDPFSTQNATAEKVFSIAELLNALIKAVRKNNGNNPTKIVIDSFRNSLEIMYFKQRYSAFYLIAVNRDDKVRERVMQHKFGNEYENIKQLLDEEYTGGKGTGFYRQYVRECIEKADIHITLRSEDETTRLNKLPKDGTSPYFSWKMQLLKYVTLIEHPGLITPSPEERIMAIAYTAKYNSGCISRQVGAAITDEYYSIKAIGWNNTPEGQVPCLMRNAEVLLNANDAVISHQLQIERKDGDLRKGEINPELQAFTPYEKTNQTFKNALRENYSSQLAANKHLLKGRNICFCFKSLQNSCSEGKNQVHTRSLHAEESAFLQITKYGGTSIKNGKLFTTASPCELCAKKAYQLGIRVIYYVDPYPGISQQHILDAGTKKPEVRLFNGAIGNAYHWLYEPLMAYKDELSLLLGLEIKDVTAQQKEKIAMLQEEKDKLAKENEELRKQLKQNGNQ